MPWPSFVHGVAGNGGVPPKPPEPLFSNDGVLFPCREAAEAWLDGPPADAAYNDTVGLLSQLVEEGFANPVDGGILVPWENLYGLLSQPSGDGVASLLSLPPVETWRPILASKGTLVDADFSVVIAGWIGPDSRPYRGNVVVYGGLLSAGSTHRAIMPEQAWRVLRAMDSFRGRSETEFGADSNRRAWAEIRSHAVAAGADLSDFLKKTVVLTPERLRLSLRRGETTGDLVEVIPCFAGAPTRWVEMFDRLAAVADHYEVPDGDGMAHVMPTPEVLSVLREIKRMPGRRIAGQRAEAFLRNPFAILGPDAAKAVDPQEFEQARDEAGIFFARFSARVLRDVEGFPYHVTIVVEESIDGEVISEEIAFSGADDLDTFLAKLEDRMTKGAQCCVWKGRELEILGDTPDQAELLRDALRDMRRPVEFTISEIFDLSRYSGRVDGIGEEKPYYSPFISRKDEGGEWFPDNVVFGLCYSPPGSSEPVALAFSQETLADFSERLRKAEEEGRHEFDFPGCPNPVNVSWAREAIATIEEAKADVARGAFDSKAKRTGDERRVRRGLIIKPNVDALDYEERRGRLSVPDGAEPNLPKSLRPEVMLKDHQRSGVAWLQRLWSLSPAACRGALLADDMGLGKTLQLLSFIAAAIEKDIACAPFLVVAPVSLLDNWKEEIEKFFQPGAMKVLTLYGTALAGLRAPRGAIDEELADEGITRLLGRGWLGDAKVVLTTYETMRDLEFSLAAVRWSAMVCDEAQKIKNPNAMVSRAAKKQNARFKIACTGTPVENTLADLWCLFDFIQPGLLGALKSFGDRYRKPIEAETDEEKARVEELKGIIEPQMLRRTKVEVAQDLPAKTERTHKLALSDQQRVLYAEAVGAFRRQAQEGGPTGGLQSHLGLIQHLRRLCSDPRPPGQSARDGEPVADIERRSPKMAWLLRQLAEIREKGEKAIVFCEFRDLQRTIQRSVAERFDFIPDIVNGDTTASSGHANNRQRRIKAFQQKPGFGAIVLSPLAVGFGVNIQAANHVIHFTRTWNPAKEDQATDRAYRIGQTKEVFVHYPIAIAEDFLTFDAKLADLLAWKRGLSADMLNGTGDLGPADFGDLGAPGGSNVFGDGPLAPADIVSLDPDAFEAFCAVLWGKHGYRRTYRTPRTGDGGIDVVAIGDGEGVLIQCKSSSVGGREIGWEAVKDVVGGAAAYAARHMKIRFSLVATTNQRFNVTARAQANINHVKLCDIDDLIRMLAEKPVSRGELDRFLFAGWGAA